MRSSFQSKIVFYLLKAFNFKNWILKKAIKLLATKNPRRKKVLPKWIRNSYIVHPQLFDEKELVTLESRKKVTNNHILFFHGGAYIFETLPFHWKLAKKIINKSYCRFTHIDYPLAPEHNYLDTFDMISSAYDTLVKHYPTDCFIFMGDSAGGGLALAFAQKLIKENYSKLPRKLILLSPWLDLTLSNPAIHNLEISDQILSVEMLQKAGLNYSNGDNQDQYLLSPINGELYNIPSTIVFYGTEELFYADCIRLKSLAESTNRSIHFSEYKNMQHDWALFPIPESKLLVLEVCNFITNNQES